MIELLYPFMIIWALWVPYIIFISLFDSSWSAFLFLLILVSLVNILLSYIYLPLGYTVAIGFGLFPWIGPLAIKLKAYSRKKTHKK